MPHKPQIIKLMTAILLLTLAGCNEGKCNRPVSDNARFMAAFDHCMDKAASLSKGGTHDNSYDTVKECENFAMAIANAQCREDKP